MIPASYLYKDIYRQAWLDPDLECARTHHTSSGGGGHPIRDGLVALLTHAITNWRRPRSVSLASDPC